MALLSRQQEIRTILLERIDLSLKAAELHTQNLKGLRAKIDTMPISGMEECEGEHQAYLAACDVEESAAADEAIQQAEAAAATDIRVLATEARITAFEIWQECENS